MEQNKSANIGMEVWLFRLLKALLCAFLISGILLLILTLLLYKLNLGEAQVTAGITLIYVVSTFSGGFVIGKLAGMRKFLWGLACGILYFALLLLITLGLYRTLNGDGSVLSAFLFCAAGGMLGGMVS